MSILFEKEIDPMSCVKYVLLVSLIFVIAGCTSSKIETVLKTSDKMVLTSDSTSKTVHINMANLNGDEETALLEMIKEKVMKSGKTLVAASKDANYQLQIKLLYLGTEKTDLTLERSLSGGVGSLMSGTGGITVKGEGASHIGLVDLIIKVDTDAGEYRSADAAQTRQADICQTYRTRIGVKASPMNADRISAIKAINERISSQIVGYL